MLDAPRDSSTRLKMLEIRFVVHPMCVVFEVLVWLNPPGGWLEIGLILCYHSISGSSKQDLWKQHTTHWWYTDTTHVPILGLKIRIPSRKTWEWSRWWEPQRLKTQVNLFQRIFLMINCLVVYQPLWKMMEFVGWDDDIPNICIYTLTLPIWLGPSWGKGPSRWACWGSEGIFFFI